MMLPGGDETEKEQMAGGAGFFDAGTAWAHDAA